MIYPKLVSSYEFFRLLRGEGFHNLRPPTPENQREFYRMEEDIKKKLGDPKLFLAISRREEWLSSTYFEQEFTVLFNSN